MLPISAAPFATTSAATNPTATTFIASVSVYPGDETTVVLHSEGFGAVFIHDVSSADYALFTSNPQCAFVFIDHGGDSNEMIFCNGATSVGDVVVY